MRRLLAPVLPVLLLAALAPKPAFATSAEISRFPEYQIDLGPFVGSGTLSSGAHVRNTSGYQIAAQRDLLITSWGLALGPRIEFSNTFLSARQSGPTETDVSTYDNRIVAAGFGLSQPIGDGSSFAQRLYLNGVGGRGFTKLSVDASTDRTFNQTLYNNIYGASWGAELGTWIPLKGNLGSNLAAVGSLYHAQQGQSSGTRDGNALNNGTVYDLSQTQPQGQTELPSSLVMRTYGAKLGLSLGF